MQKRTREILALVLLMLLAIVGVGAMAWYILLGHNWNVTASTIDDSIGQMDGYTVILYEGTRPLTESDIRSDFSDGAQPADLDSIAADYSSKGANVYKLQASDLLRYQKPFIKSQNKFRLGLLSVNNSELRSSIRANIKYLEKRRANALVAISNDKTLGRLAEEGVINGLSVIIYNNPDGLTPNGKYCGSTYCVSATAAGTIGAVIISPSGVYSSKIMQ